MWPHLPRSSVAHLSPGVILWTICISLVEQRGRVDISEPRRAPVFFVDWPIEHLHIESFFNSQSTCIYVPFVSDCKRNQPSLFIRSEIVSGWRVICLRALEPHFKKSCKRKPTTINFIFKCVYYSTLYLRLYFRITFEGRALK